MPSLRTRWCFNCCFRAVPCAWAQFFLVCLMFCWWLSCCLCSTEDVICTKCEKKGKNWGAKWKNSVLQEGLRTQRVITSLCLDVRMSPNGTGRSPPVAPQSQSTRHSCEAYRVLSIPKNITILAVDPILRSGNSWDLIWHPCGVLTSKTDDICVSHS